MYIYLITNNINNKKYVGITNNPIKRWQNHCSKNRKPTVIQNAIQKYGKENFTFKIIEDNVPIEKIDEKEIYYIQFYNSLVENGQGYNVAKGGMYNINNSIHYGENNGRAVLTDKEAQYIKSHRDIPEYVLYDQFSEKISYTAFKDIYNNKTYKNIVPTVDPYPYNCEFSLQFASTGKLTYEQVVDLRKQFQNKVFWKDAYTEEYQKIYPNEMSFWNVYMGNRYKLVMPEVFTEENLHFQRSISHSSENNGRSKLTKNDVLDIRYKADIEKMTAREIHQLYPQVTLTSIKNIINRKTWKNI